MELTIVKSEHMTDWYLIERAEHDGRAWIEEVSPNVSELRCSSRFSDADVEGYGDEMLAIADAIESRGSVRFKRCAVNATSEPVTFCSPRNSRVDGECSLAEADSLVVKIRAMCKAVGMIDAASAH